MKSENSNDKYLKIHVIIIKLKKMSNIRNWIILFLFILLIHSILFFQQTKNIDGATSQNKILYAVDNISYDAYAENNIDEPVYSLKYQYPVNLLVVPDSFQYGYLELNLMTLNIHVSALPEFGLYSRDPFHFIANISNFEFTSIIVITNDIGEIVHKKLDIIDINNKTSEKDIEIKYNWSTNKPDVYSLKNIVKNNYTISLGIQSSIIYTNGTVSSVRLSTNGMEISWDRENTKIVKIPYNSFNLKVIWPNYYPIYLEISSIALLVIILLYIYQKDKNQVLSGS